MSVGTVREKLHAMATALGAPQYAEPTNGRRVWTARALQAAASACGCRGGAAAPSAASSAAPCPFCSPADDDDAMRHAGDARAEVVAAEVLASGGSRLEVMRAKLRAGGIAGGLGAPGGGGGGGGGGCGSGGGGGCGSGGGGDEGEDDVDAPPAVWRPP